MRDIDKNDVDIEQLFKWRKEVKVTDPVTDESATLYLRLVGDADLGRARAHALRNSGDLRRKLQEDGTDERISFMAEVTEVSEENKDAIVSVILLLHIERFQSEAMLDVDLPYPKELDSDASLEEQEKYQEDVDSYPERFTELVVEKSKELQEVDKENYLKMSAVELHSEYEGLMINRLCTDEMNDSFYDFILYLAVYTDEDCKEKAFSSFESYKNASSTLKDNLIKEYKSLEMGMGVLKKSQEATESE